GSVSPLSSLGCPRIAIIGSKAIKILLVRVWLPVLLGTFHINQLHFERDFKVAFISCPLLRLSGLRWCSPAKHFALSRRRSRVQIPAGALFDQRMAQKYFLLVTSCRFTAVR